MIKSDLGNFFTLLILALIAGFGYYFGFMALALRRVQLSETRRVAGLKAIGLGLVYLAGAIAASAVAILFYFSQS